MQAYLVEYYTYYLRYTTPIMYASWLNSTISLSFSYHLRVTLMSYDYGTTQHLGTQQPEAYCISILVHMIYIERVKTWLKRTLDIM